MEIILPIQIIGKSTFCVFIKFFLSEKPILYKRLKGNKIRDIKLFLCNQNCGVLNIFICQLNQKNWVDYQFFLLANYYFLKFH